MPAERGPSGTGHDTRMVFRFEIAGEKWNWPVSGDDSVRAFRELLIRAQIEYVVSGDANCADPTIPSAGERDRRQIARLTEALAFYADEDNYFDTYPDETQVPVQCPALADEGSRARAVLADEEDAQP